jgi:hypothetical protein
VTSQLLFAALSVLWFVGMLLTWAWRPFWYKVDLTDLDFAEDGTWDELREEFLEENQDDDFVRTAPSWLFHFCWTLVRLWICVTWPWQACRYYWWRARINYRAYRLYRRRKRLKNNARP